MNGYGCTSIFSKTYKMHPEKKPALETPSGKPADLAVKQWGWINLESEVPYIDGEI